MPERLLTERRHPHANRTFPPSVGLLHEGYQRVERQLRLVRIRLQYCVPASNRRDSTISSAATGQVLPPPQPASPTKRRSHIAREEKGHGCSWARAHKAEPGRSHPRMRSARLPAVALLLPYSIHDLGGHISGGLWPRRGWSPSLQRRAQDTSTNQLLLLLGVVLQLAGNNLRHWSVALAHYNFLASANAPEMGAQPSFQISDVYRPHM